MKRDLILCFIIILLNGCYRTDDKLLVAQDEENIKPFHLYLKRLELYKSGNFIFSIIPVDTSFDKVQTYEGTYIIESDTFYFNGNIGYKKAILKNGEIEFLNYPFKLNIVQNKTSIISENKLIKETDFTFFTYSEAHEKLFKKGINVDLETKEINRIRELLQKKMIDESKKFIHYSANENEYYKQCVAILNDKNEIEVWVQCLAKKSSASHGWKSQIKQICDGGDSNFRFKINLTTGIIYDFNINGYA